MQPEPTVAEEYFAKLIAFWHGQKMIVGNETVASRAGYGRWGDSPSHYMNDHWRSYITAAKAVIEAANA